MPWHGHCNSPVKTHGQRRPGGSGGFPAQDKGVHPRCRLAVRMWRLFCFSILVIKEQAMEDKKSVDARQPILSRREFCSTALGASLMAMVPPGARSGAWAAGSDAPEKKEVKIGFIPLTDCASVVMAAVNKFDEKYGIKIIPSKEASWASVRDKLVNGELDAAHVLYGLVYGVQPGVGGQKKDMSLMMSLNNNGQAITLSNKLKEKGVMDGASLAKAVLSKDREYTFAQTFPTGTHALLLYYWLAANGINQMKDAK